MKKLLVLLCIAGAIAFTFVVGCPFRFITRIPCPGCGMTTAFISLFHLDFRAAFAYHPLFPFVIFMGGAFLVVVFRYSYVSKKSVIRLEAIDYHLMMKNLFSHLLTKIVVGFYIGAFVLVYIIRFSTIDIHH